MAAWKADLKSGGTEKVSFIQAGYLYCQGWGGTACRYGLRVGRARGGGRSLRCIICC